MLLTVLLTYVWLNMFLEQLCPSSGAHNYKYISDYHMVIRDIVVSS
jgi:hypothetical protein